jgi:enoyl reductase-like protein
LNGESKFATGEWVTPKIPANQLLGLGVSANKETKTSKSSKQLLGELHNDHQYLEKFFNDKGM